MELQVLSQDYWASRSLCYLCRNFVTLNSGEDYNQLKPLVQIDILDFELYENSKEFYSTYHLANDKTHRIYSDKLTLHVLEFLRKVSDSEQTKRAVLNKSGTALNVILSNCTKLRKFGQRSMGIAFLP